jgi:hypothetical protein
MRRARHRAQVRPSVRGQRIDHCLLRRYGIALSLRQHAHLAHDGQVGGEDVLEPGRPRDLRWLPQRGPPVFAAELVSLLPVLLLLLRCTQVR